MIEAREFVEAARRRGYDWYAGVPCSFLTPFINYAIGDPALSYLSAANEGDAVAAAAGAVLGGRRGVAMMQNSGLGNAVSPLTSLCHVFRIPVLLIVTLRGEPGRHDEPQHELMGRITGELLDTLRVPWEMFPEQPAAIEDCLGRAEARMLSRGRPYALVMRKGSVAPHPLERRPAALREPVAPQGGFRLPPQRRPSRSEALGRVLELTAATDTVVIATTGYTGRELYALADRPNHLYVVGSMGCASSLALGLALARRDLRVVVVDGDGAALMRMGNLATIGACAGPNLLHLILDNEVHDSTGGQATVSPAVAFAGVAAACGYARALAGDGVELVDRLLAGEAVAGPSLGHLKIRPGAPPDLPRPAVTPPQVRRRLLAHLGVDAWFADGDLP